MWILGSYVKSCFLIGYFRRSMANQSRGRFRGSVVFARFFHISSQVRINNWVFLNGSSIVTSVDLIYRTCVCRENRFYILKIQLTHINEQTKHIYNRQEAVGTNSYTNKVVDSINASCYKLFIWVRIYNYHSCCI